MQACRGHNGTLDLSLRRLRGVVYVNGVGSMDEHAEAALVRVVTPLLVGTSIRRVIVDLCDVEGVDGGARSAIEQLRTLADGHDRQLAVLISSPREELSEARRRRRDREQSVVGRSACWSGAAIRAS